MVDILLATYNGEQYLAEQLDSLFSQTMRDFKIYARDDGSDDGTVAILEEYKSRYPDMMELILDEKPTGSAKDNFFRLLDFSGSAYTMLCDQDDVWQPNKIEITLAAMENADKTYGDTPLLVHTDLAVADNGLNVLDASLFHMQRLSGAYTSLSRVVAQNHITGCTVMLNEKLRGLMRAGDHILMHDWWLGLIASAFGHIVFVPVSTALYRQHGENEVGAKDVMSRTYIRGKLQDREGIRKVIADTYVQAHTFMTVYDDLLSAEQKALLQEYVNLHYYNAGKRFTTMLRCHFFKSGIFRKLGQIVFG